MFPAMIFLIIAKTTPKVFLLTSRNSGRPLLRRGSRLRFLMQMELEGKGNSVCLKFGRFEIYIKSPTMSAFAPVVVQLFYTNHPVSRISKWNLWICVWPSFSRTSGLPSMLFGRGNHVLRRRVRNLVHLSSRTSSSGVWPEFGFYY